jgi:hypothetical protein
MVLLLIILMPAVLAQQNVITSGGYAVGAEGSVSFSIGQTAWNISSASNGSIIQGVQQPFEISVISSFSDLNINLNYSVYPNPTRGIITLSIEKPYCIGLKYQLISLTGERLEEKIIEATNTEIDLSGFAPATYLLRICRGQALVKLFKIVKH